MWEVFPGKGPTKRRAAAALSRSSLNGTAFADGWLCFESDKEKRRLAPIPRGWESHDKKTLEALCGKATLVPARHARRVNGSA